MSGTFLWQRPLGVRAVGGRLDASACDFSSQAQELKFTHNLQGAETVAPLSIGDT